VSDRLPAQVLTALVGSGLVAWHGARALWWLAPGSLLLEIESPGPTEVPAALTSTDAALRNHGFALLGTHLEQPRLGKAVLHYDFAAPAHGCFASAFVDTEGARVYFLSPTTGGLVLTAGFRRPSSELPRYQSSFLEGASVERLVKAHLRRAKAQGAPQGSFTLEARVQLAHDWYAGVGAREVRAANAVSLLWMVGGLGMVASAVWFSLSSTA
jgi:hypothetical protein